MQRTGREELLYKVVFFKVVKMSDWGKLVDALTAELWVILA